ncbi:MAG: hypothetical protein H0X17_14380 [Deltaproteobacteria bacterium]|nr:hypothetical protein [Deltaproteobacteria bacterium]
MGTGSSSNSAIVAIFAIMLLAMLGSFIAWQTGVLGDGAHERRGTDTDVTTRTQNP